MQRNDSLDSFDSLVSFVSSMYDEGDSNTELDEIDFFGQMEHYLDSEMESETESETERSTFNQSSYVEPERKIIEGSSLNSDQFGFVFMLRVIT